MDDANVLVLEEVGETLHPRAGVLVRVTELESRDLLPVREDAARVLAFVIAHEHDCRRKRAEVRDDRHGPWASID